MRIILDEPDNWGIGQYPEISDIVLINVVRAQAIPGCEWASNLSCSWVQMKQAALANKPDIVMPIFDDVSDPADK